MMYKITFTVSYPSIADKNFNVTMNLPDDKPIDEILDTTILEIIENQYKGIFHYKIGHAYINFQNALALSLKAERVETAKIIPLPEKNS